MKTGFGQGLAVGEKKEDRVAVLIGARINCLLLLTSMALSIAAPESKSPAGFYCSGADQILLDPALRRVLAGSSHTLGGLCSITQCFARLRQGNGGQEFCWRCPAL
jgi:hypothetical protein